jgi:hypothetical protein
VALIGSPSAVSAARVSAHGTRRILSWRDRVLAKPHDADSGVRVEFVADAA